MPKRRAISFVSSAPDDWEFDDAGNLIAPGNQWNAQFVAQALRSNGFEVEQPQNHEDYGWEFFCSTGKEKFWLLIAMGFNPDENLIWVNKTGFLSWLFQGETARDGLLQVLQTALICDARFSEVHEASI